jgi:Fuc2NAc and GlcNAc transferase
MVAVFLLAIPCLWFKHLIAADLAWALFGGSVLVALIGILDDHRPLPAWLRFCVHCGASAWALWRLGGVSALPLGAAGAQIPSWAVSVLVLLGMVWLINLYNFMDGIDGIAGVEAVCVSGLGGLLLARSGCGGEASVAWVLAFASAGFLVWNWPPAKIFMGDAGSGFLGYVLAVFVVSSSKVQARLFWPWIILLGVFVADATFTLLRRLLSGARWYEAHCSHAYQHAAKQHGSHLKVTLTIAAINVLWLFPLAWSAVLYPARAPWIALLALASVGCVALHYEAGKNRALPPDPAEDRSEIPLHHLRGAFCLVSSKTIHCAFAKVRLPSMINAEQDVCINDESDLDAETRGSKVAQSLHESTTSRLSQPSSADKVKPAFRERLRAHFKSHAWTTASNRSSSCPALYWRFRFPG